jgi:Leucine-rich repeat (LRR) protein
MMMKYIYEKKLNEWIKNGCDNEVGLKIISLDIKRGKNKLIPKEIGKLINLKLIFLTDNNLTEIPEEISNLKNLKVIYLDKNKLKEINEICNNTNIELLNLVDNEIKKMPIEIGNLINMEDLYMSNNKLKTIPKEIGNLIKMRVILLNNNNLKEIPKEICNLINLEKLDLSNNEIIEIPKEIGNLVNLKEINISNNFLTTIPIEITKIRNVIILYNNNPIEYMSPEVVRYINRFKITQKIYADRQSVHNNKIQKGIINAINYIMAIKPIYKMENIKEIINKNEYIDKDVKNILYKYMKNKDIHSILNITFEELLINVLSFIEQHKEKEEIYKILCQEMKESVNKCFTGIMSRLINCLNGFDENIIINISDNEQISNIIILVENKLKDENKYTKELHKEIVMKELYDRGYEKDVVDEWMEYL